MQDTGQAGPHLDRLIIISKPSSVVVYVDYLVCTANTTASLCDGMDNSVVLRKAICCVMHIVIDVHVMRPQHLHSTYGYRIYGFITRVVEAVNETLRKTFPVAANRNTVKIGCLPDEGQYMIGCLEGGVRSYRKLGVKTLDLKREQGVGRKDKHKQHYWYG